MTDREHSLEPDKEKLTMCGEMATVSINMEQYNEDEVGVSVRV